jgi:hypothetical protein
MLIVIGLKTLLDLGDRPLSGVEVKMKSRTLGQDTEKSIRLPD